MRIPNKTLPVTAITRNTPKHLAFGGRHWGLLGDSFQALSSAPPYFGSIPPGVPPTNSFGYTAHALSWLNVLSNNAFFFDSFYDNYAVGGGTIQTSLDNLPYIIARNVDVVVIGGPHNDTIACTPAAVWQANYVLLINQILDAGVIPVLVLDPPMGKVSLGNLPLPALRAGIISNNHWIKRFALNNGLLTWDWYTPTVNPNDPLGGMFPGMEMPDNVHPSSHGGFAIALHGLRDLAPILGTGSDGLAVAQNDVWDAQQNVYGNLLDNGLFLAAYTPDTSPLPYAAVTAPVGWSFFQANGGYGKTVVGSIVPNPDGFGNLFKTVLSGTSTGAKSQAVIIMRYVIDTLPNQAVEGYVYVSVAPNSPFHAIAAKIKGGGNTSSSMNSVYPAGLGTNLAWSGVIYIPPVVIPIGYNAAFEIAFCYDDSESGANGNFSGTVSVGRPALRYLPEI